MIRKFRRSSSSPSSSMAATALDPTLTLKMGKKESQNNNNNKNVVIEEIEGLIRVYKDGHVERPQIVPCVGPSLDSALGLTCRDVVVDKYTNVWARLYVPNFAACNLPLLVYFHGGGFCVGSAAWSCYHEFLAKLASKCNIVILSVNYRLAPENPLPAAYEDGFKTLVWLHQQESAPASQWWAKKCNLSRIHLSGDSAGANIAFHVALMRRNRLPPEIKLQGLILIQPFFGGETRTNSERYSVQPPRSALTVAASDAYWRMSLPGGANRDHPWCNPTLAGLGQKKLRIMVCVAETDILKDRNLEFCRKLGVEEPVMFKGVGHAFQILNKSALAQSRTSLLIDYVSNFISTTKY